jgi:hypothetical protein
MGLLDKAKDAAKTVGEVSQGAFAAGKDKLDESIAKQKVGDLKEELGGIVYLQRTGKAPDDAEAEIDRLVGEIKAREARGSE